MVQPSLQARELISLLNFQNRTSTMSLSHLFSCSVVLPSIFNRKHQHAMLLSKATTSNYLFFSFFRNLAKIIQDKLPLEKELDFLFTCTKLFSFTCANL